MKLRATIFYTASDSCEIRTEDGGVACIYHNVEHFITDYYQSRDYNEQVDYEKIAEGKGQYKDWNATKDKIDKEMIVDALDRLVMVNDGFEITEHINTKPPHIAKEPRPSEAK